MSDHHVRQGLRIRPTRLDSADVLALSQYGDAVADLHDLVELVGDDDDGLAVLLHVPKDLEELDRLLGGQHCSRLIQHQDVRTAEEDLDDLHGLLLRHGHVVHLHRRIDLETVAVADRLDPALDLSHVHSAFIKTENHVLGRGEDLDELVVLMDHSNAMLVGILRRPDIYLLSILEYAAFIRLIDSAEHVHQRRLSASVLSQQGEDLTPSDGEVYVVVGQHLPEALGDAQHLNGVALFQ